MCHLCHFTIQASVLGNEMEQDAEEGSGKNTFTGTLCTVGVGMVGVVEKWWITHILQQLCQQFCL